MFIHIGSNMIISDRVCVGIFNVETLGLSEENKWITGNLKPEDKVVVININNNITATNVSPFTIIKRNPIDHEDIIWSREDDKKL